VHPVEIQPADHRPVELIFIKIEKLTKRKKIRSGCRHDGNRTEIRRIFRSYRIYDGVVYLHVRDLFLTPYILKGFCYISKVILNLIDHII
jgi:hypothetical protein